MDDRPEQAGGAGSGAGSGATNDAGSGTDSAAGIGAGTDAGGGRADRLEDHLGALSRSRPAACQPRRVRRRRPRARPRRLWESSRPAAVAGAGRRRRSGGDRRRRRRAVRHPRRLHRRARDRPFVAAEADALDDIAFARLMVDPATPRDEVVRLAGGATPAKLARVVASASPGGAADGDRQDAGPAHALHPGARHEPPRRPAAPGRRRRHGRRLRLPRAGDDRARSWPTRPSNALALLIGSQVGAAGALTQCSVEEALELELGLRGLTTYAETVSLYGTEQVFIDGDDTPWSKAFLCSAYASRGLKMRVTSGGGAEALMGAAEGRSMFYLESRCVALARAIGAQGVQNGGIDGASVVGSVPDGMRELLAENLLVMLRDLESCSGNDALVLGVGHAPHRAHACRFFWPAPTSSSRASAPSGATTTCSGPPTSTARTSTTTWCCSATGGSTAACAPSARPGSARRGSAPPRPRRRLPRPRDSPTSATTGSPRWSTPPARKTSILSIPR